MLFLLLAHSICLAYYGFLLLLIKYYIILTNPSLLLCLHSLWLYLELYFFLFWFLLSRLEKFCICSFLHSIWLETSRIFILLILYFTWLVPCRILLLQFLFYMWLALFRIILLSFMVLDYKILFLLLSHCTLLINHYFDHMAESEEFWIECDWRVADELSYVSCI